MKEPLLLRFGGCELHLQRRELFVDGQRRSIPPKVYDLLVMLVKQRDRAVSKYELSAALWPGKVLSDSVLARTVMKVRRAIGDVATESQWIRSVHGFGYRFVGAVSEVATLPPTSTTAKAVDRRRGGQRIGVLPCVNATGDSTLDWMQIGLMSLVVHSLSQERRLAPVPVTAMLEAVPSSAASDSPDEQARSAIKLLDLDHVVHATVHRQSHLLWLDYRVFGRGEESLRGSLSGSDPLALGEQVAKAVCAGLFRGGRPQRFTSRDPFVNQMFARAVELFRQEDGAAAAPLFELVCNMEPDEIGALQWHVRCRAVMKDPAAVPLVESLLARAQSIGDVRTQAMGHAFMAFALPQRQSDADSLKRQMHAQAALTLATGHEHEDWFGMLLFHLGMQAALSGQTHEALSLCRRALVACRLGGNLKHVSIVQQNLALIEIGAGDLINARERLEIVLRGHRSLHNTKPAAHALAWLALANAGLGQIDAAFEQCDEMLSLLGVLRHPGWECSALAAAVSVYAERLSAGHIEKLLAAFDGIADKSHPLVQGPWLAAQAGLAICRGELTRALVQLDDAIQAAHSGPGAPFVRIAGTSRLRLAVAAGNFSVVDELLAKFAARAGPNMSPDGRAAMQHARAARLIHDGAVDEALNVLAQIIRDTPLGRAHAFARFDAAWLHLEQGSVAHAQSLLAPLGSWRHEHPVGLATQARLMSAIGEHRAAVAAQARALGRHLGYAPAWHVEAHRLYEQSATGAAARFPRLPRLVSDSWWVDRSA